MKSRSRWHLPLSVQIGSLILGLSFLIFTPLWWWIESTLEQNLQTKEINVIHQLNQNWVNQVNDKLVRAEASIQRFGNLISTNTEPPSAALEARFDALIQRDPDGAWRTRPDLFDGQQDAGVWIPRYLTMTGELKSFFIQASEMTALYGAGTLGSIYEDTYVLPAVSGEAVYWPNQPQFIYQASADLDYTPTDWVQLANPSRNPTGRPMWTPASFDPTPKIWMISVVAPYTYQGAWAGSVGHDIRIDALTADVRSALVLPDSHFTLLSPDGVILVSDVHQADVESSQGTFTIQQSSRPFLQSLWTTSQSDPSLTTQIIRSPDEQIVGFIYRIEATGWTVLVTVPMDSISAIVQGTFNRFRLIFLLSFIAMLALVAFILTQLIFRVVRRLVHGTNQVIAHQWDVRFDLGNAKELHQISGALNKMVGELEQNHQTLLEQNHELDRHKQELIDINANLEQKIDERTLELQEALVSAREAHQEAETANHHKSRFLATMSHELRTPLNIIINFAEMMLHGTYGTVNDQQAMMQERIRDNGVHLLTLINDILDFSKIEAGQLTLRLEELAIGPLVEGVVETMQGLAKKKHLNLTVAPPQTAIPQVRGDRVRLQQVLINLLSNAIKFTDTGSVTVHLTQLDDHLIAVDIHDTGIGIAPEDQANIFGEFWQVEQSPDRRYTGTGLGLAICKQLIDLHAGTLTLQSEPGKGSTFRFTVPIAKHHEDTPTRDDAPANGASSPTPEGESITKGGSA